MMGNSLKIGDRALYVKKSKLLLARLGTKGSFRGFLCRFFAIRALTTIFPLASYPGVGHTVQFHFRIVSYLRGPFVPRHIFAPA